MSRGQVSENTGISRSLRPVALSVLIGALFCALLLLLMSVLLSTQNIPQFAIHPMASFAISAGGFVAGFCCAKIMREKGLAYGAFCGAVLTVIVLLAALALKDNGFGIPALLKTAFIMLSSMLGGVLGVNTRRRRK